MLLLTELGDRNQSLRDRQQRVSRSRCRRRSTGMDFRPRLKTARCVAAVMPVSRSSDLPATDGGFRREIRDFVARCDQQRERLANARILESVHWPAPERRF